MNNCDKKIIITSNSVWNVVNFRKGIILDIIDNNFEVIIVAPSDEYMPKLRKLGCKYININIDNSGVSPINDLYLIFQYLKVFYKVKPDVVLSYTVKPNIYGSIAANIYSIPIINNISGLGTAFIKGGALGNIVRWLYNISLNKSKHVFFQNNDDRGLFLNKNLVTREQSSNLPGSGVDLWYYQPINIDFSKRNSEFIFLLVARLIWDKGIKEYIDAARIIKRSNPSVRFQILGFLNVDNQTAVLQSDIDSWTREGVVEYLGDTDDVKFFIQESYCVVLPSYREGTPKVLLEAAAIGRPIITTNVEGCKEVVDDGVNGYLCNVRDANDLAEKMNTMINMDFKDIEKMGSMGRKKMEREFDEKIVINQYMSEVNQITEKL